MVIVIPSVFESAPLQDQQRKRYPKYTESRILLNSKYHSRVSKLLPAKIQDIHPQASRNKMDESEEYLKNDHQIPKGWKHGSSLGITNAYNKTDDDKYNPNKFESVISRSTNRETQSQIPKPSQSVPSRIRNNPSIPEMSAIANKDKVRTSWRDSSPGYSESGTDFEGEFPLGPRIGSPSPASRIKEKVHKENRRPNISHSTRNTHTFVGQNSVSKHQRDEFKLKKFSAHSNPFPMKRRDLNLFKKTTNENSGEYDAHLIDTENLDEKREPQNNISSNQELIPQSYSELLQHNSDDSQKITTEVEQIEAEYRNSCPDTLKPPVSLRSEFRSLASGNSDKDTEVNHRDSSSVSENNFGLPAFIQSKKGPIADTSQMRPCSSRSSPTSLEKRISTSGTKLYPDEELNNSEELVHRQDICIEELNGTREQWIPLKRASLELEKSPSVDLDTSPQNSYNLRSEGSPSLKKADSMLLKLKDEKLKQSFLPIKTYPSHAKVGDNKIEEKYPDCDTVGTNETYSQPKLNNGTLFSSESPKENNESKSSGRYISQPESDIDAVECIAAESNLLELQPADNKSEFSNNFSVSTVQSYITHETSNMRPKHNMEFLPIETPKITGAFIQTPVLSRTLERKTQINAHRRSVSLEDLDNKREDLSDSQVSKLPIQSTSVLSRQEGYIFASTRPALINTHHRTTVSEDIRLIKSEENIEDSEIDFLEEGVMERNGSVEKMTSDKLVDPEDVETNFLRDIQSSGRWPDQMIIESMNRKLKKASHSIHDAKQGIERLEKQVSSSTSCQAVEAKHEYFQKPFKIPRLYISVPSVRSDKPTGFFYNRNWQLTWLGLIFFSVLLWLITELTFCEVYCHPKNSTTNEWHPSDPFFPYAIPTKMDQWSGRIFSETIKRIFDWWNPSRHTLRRPRQPYSGYDWWVGEYGPAPTYVQEPYYNVNERIDNDEIWE